MCGIFGALNLSAPRPVGEPLLRAMGRVLHHRGPDAEGFYAEAGFGFGMRRLSIIDVTAGNQPIANEDRSVWVVFNGEIYNYRDLTRQLQARGHRFSTSSDTEVIVHLYEEHGAECVRRLRGMFAFALWDRSRRLLLLARDRLGIKPLYYSITGGRLTFGSELKAVLVDPEVRRDIDPHALSAYLRYGYVADPLTILATVRKLPPGHLLVAERGSVQTRCYWDAAPLFAAPARRTGGAADPEELDRRLAEAVRLHLVSDVPLGAFLSGGIDSSLVVALMARSLGHPVKTFSMGFDDPAYDELPYARDVARHLGTEHQDLVLEPQSLDIVPRIAWHLDEPFADASALPTYFVSRLARRSVKVVLSGDGGDELFGGYDRYVTHLRRRWADRIPGSIRQSVLRPLAGLLPPGMPGRRFLHSITLGSDRRYLDSISYLPPALQGALLSPDILQQLPQDPDASYRRHLEGVRFPSVLGRLQALDVKTYLPADILTKVDRMSMAHSLEARVPLLDHPLVEYVGGLPATDKMRGPTTKYVLKQIARRYLPAHIVDRRKQGFAIPLARWFRGDLNGFLRDVLHDPKTRQRPYFDARGVSEVVEEAFAHRRVSQLWVLALLELWNRCVLELSPGGA
jgi:asparagine synthase (glutamine-hydrolysing)